MVRAEDTAKVKLENRDVFPSTHKRLPTISRDGQSLATYQWSHVDKHGELVTVSIRLEESGSGAILHGYFGSTRSRMGIVSDTPGSRADQSNGDANVWQGAQNLSPVIFFVFES